MKTLHEKLKQLSRALEFVNIDTLGELEKTLFENQKAAAAAKSRDATVRRIAYCERKRGFGAGRSADLGLGIAASTLPRLSGQR